MSAHYPGPELFAARSVHGQRQPVVLELPLDDHSPSTLYSRLRARFGKAILLESGKNARRSYVGCIGAERFSASDISSSSSVSVERDPFATLRRLLRSERIIANERVTGFSGGYVGYFSYDMARCIERLPDLTTANPKYPDCQLVLVEAFCEIDHVDRVLRIIASRRCGDDSLATYALTCADIEALRDAINHTGDSEAPHVTGTPALGHAQASVTRAEFEEMVRRAMAYIRAGDVFQVNLSLRFDAPFAGDPLALYDRLRVINPAPFMALLELDDVAIVSASPELLLRLRDRVIETRPIAGTRPRGATEEQDERNVRKLSENEKERAEHLMLVDLERNDIGRVARYGSVRVDEFMGIERYSHVVHIVSNIRGELADGKDVVDAVRACFPGGTITGAPKVRAMEIIEELEPYRRGVYTGSIGWIGFNGDAELNIAIRTIVIAAGRAYAQAGAGIVADSVPEHEYHESIRKAAAALEALGLRV